MKTISINRVICWPDIRPNQSESQKVIASDCVISQVEGKIIKNDI